MEIMDYSIYSNEEIAQMALQMTASELNQEISKMLPSQITAVILILRPITEPKWRDKILAICQGLQSPEQLEALGKGVNSEQALEVVKSFPINDQENYWKISPFLVGMAHQVFLTILGTASGELLGNLKMEGINEAIQHHLNLFIHELTIENEGMIEQFSLLEQEIQELDLESITFAKFYAIQDKIIQLKLRIQGWLEKLNRALSLAWNTNRPDFIERLTSLKESFVKIDRYLLGDLPEGENYGTGLFEKLETHLSSVYGNLSNHSEDYKALLDDELATEALARLSVWYLKDYWELGLLPEITSLEQLDLDTAGHTPQERMIHQENLLKQILIRLEKLKLETVKDIKMAHIYSKEMLKEYISQHKHIFT